MTQRQFTPSRPHPAAAPLNPDSVGFEDLLRTPPHHREAELSVLSSILIDHDVLHDTLVSRLQPDMFYFRAHRLAYEAMRRVHQRGDPVDLVTLSEELTRTQHLDDVGGIAFLTGLADQSPTAAYATTHARIVHEQYQLRFAIQGARNVITAALAKDLGKVTLAAEQLIAPHPTEVRAQTYAAVANAAYEKILARMRGESDDLLRSGFAGLEKQHAGFARQSLTIVAARPSMGKAQPLDALILTADGFRRMGDLKLGDELASVDGAPSFVTGVYPQGRRTVYKVTFADGRSTLACDEHLWHVTDHGARTTQVLSTLHLRRLVSGRKGKHHLSVPLFSGHFGHQDQLPVDPELFGRALGDRSAERDHTALLAQVTDPGEPRLPASYLNAPRSARAALLRGLLDEGGLIEDADIAIPMASRALAEDIAVLVRSLGGEAAVRRLPAGGEVALRLPQYDGLFSCDGRRRRAQADAACPPSLQVTKVERVGESECQCIRVSHSSSLYVTDDFVVTHNTAFSMSVVHNLARARRHILVVSLEMPATELEMRRIAAAARVNLDRIIRGNLSPRDLERIEAAVHKYEECHVHYMDDPNTTLDAIRREARRLQRAGGLDMILIDYIGLLELNGPDKNDFDRLTRLSNRLKIMARELDVAMIALSQLSRAVEQRPDKRPMLSDLRQTGALEQDADVVMFLYRDEYYNRETLSPGVIEIILGKQRNGPTGIVRLIFQSMTASIHNLPQEAQA